MEALEMKIEANPTPEQLKWLVLALAIVLGWHYDQILGLVAS